MGIGIASRGRGLFSNGKRIPATGFYPAAGLCFGKRQMADLANVHPRCRFLSQRRLGLLLKYLPASVLIAGGGDASAVIEQCGDSGRSSRSFVVPSRRVSRLCESATSASSHHGPASDTAPEVLEGRAEPWEEVVLRAASAAKLHAEPREVSLTLLVTNRRRFLPALADQIVPGVTSFFRREVTLFCDEVSGSST
eukprot:gene12870-biopygen1391